MGKAWVGEGLEGSGQQMDKGRRYQHAGAKVPRDEEEVMGDGEPREALDDDGEGARCWL